MEMLSGFREGAPSGYVRGGAILDTNDSDAESDASGQGVFDYSAEVVSVASSVDSASMKMKNNHESGRKSDRSKKKMRPRPGGAFSALTPSMWPQDILTKFGEDSAAEAEDPEGEILRFLCYSYVIILVYNLRSCN